MRQYTIDIRQYPRVNATLVVGYWVSEASYTSASWSKNISMGGVLLRTNRAFRSGTRAALCIDIPFMHDPVDVVGEVLASYEVPNTPVYDTRVLFTEADENAVEGLRRLTGWRKRGPQMRLVPNAPRSA